MIEQLVQIKLDFQNKLTEATTLAEVDQIFLDLFGKNGAITVLPKEFANLPKEELKDIGPVFNQTKQSLESAVEEARNRIKEVFYQSLTVETLDLSDTTIKSRTGHLHPLTIAANQITDAFYKLGFSLFDAPHIDTDFNNFEVLNIPPQHPARDLWDTLYISGGSDKTNEKLLLRTHTSNAQIHIMNSTKPPIRAMVIGPCFRYENLDARHEHTFDQFEIVFVDKNLSLANLQYLSEYFLQSIFGPETQVKLRPKYYPFVEPGAGVDGLCIFCKGVGCKICSGTGWLELAGSGMMHPVVLKNGGIDSEVYSGIAWGFGPARMMMLKYGIADLREFHTGDLRFLEKF